MSEKVRTRLEELDDFEEVSRSLLSTEPCGLLFLLPRELSLVVALINSRAVHCASSSGTTDPGKRPRSCSGSGWPSKLSVLTAMPEQAQVV